MVLPQHSSSLSPQFELEEKSPVRRGGLYEEYLWCRPERLIYDAQDHPTEYTPQDRTLLEDLYQGKVQYEGLTEELKDLLDELTLNMLMRVERPAAPTKPPQRPVVQKPDSQEEEDDETPEEGASEVVGGDGMPAFWWLK